MRPSLRILFLPTMDLYTPGCPKWRKGEERVLRGALHSGILADELARAERQEEGHVAAAASLGAGGALGDARLERRELVGDGLRGQECGAVGFCADVWHVERES